MKDKNIAWLGLLTIIIIGCAGFWLLSLIVIYLLGGWFYIIWKNKIIKNFVEDWYYGRIWQVLIFPITNAYMVILERRCDTKRVEFIGPISIKDKLPIMLYVPFMLVFWLPIVFVNLGLGMIVIVLALILPE